jgi:predicted amino acid racemase
LATPCLSIDLEKIEHNARVVVGLCGQHGIEVAGVTKAVCGMPEVAQAMLRGGVTSIADSRLANIHRLKAGGIETEFVLLRIPALADVHDTVLSTDVSLNSELAVLAALSQVAERLGRQHQVLLMVDLGDLREGVWPGALEGLVRKTIQLPGIRIVGLGTNLACFSGVPPSVDNMLRLVALGEAMEQIIGYELRWLSGLNSSGLELIASGRLPPRINHARIGEAILLGRETTHRSPWPETYQDAFVLSAEVLELKRKPSLPAGERGEDAFGEQPVFEDKGLRDRALLNLGREDVDVAGIRPLQPRLEIVGASSGYLVLDVTEADGDIRVGDELAFSLNYAALLAAMASEYVIKQLQPGGTV